MQQLVLTLQEATKHIPDDQSVNLQPIKSKTYSLLSFHKRTLSLHQYNLRQLAFFLVLSGKSEASHQDMQ